RESEVDEQPTARRWKPSQRLRMAINSWRHVRHFIEAGSDLRLIAVGNRDPAVPPNGRPSEACRHQHVSRPTRGDEPSDRRPIVERMLGGRMRNFELAIAIDDDVRPERECQQYGRDRDRETKPLTIVPGTTERLRRPVDGECHSNVEGRYNPDR